MSDYRKWVGCGVGWLIGGPLGGLLGFIAGNEFDRHSVFTEAKSSLPLDNLQTNVLVLCSHIARLRGNYPLDYFNQCRIVFAYHLSHEHIDRVMEVFHHCLQKEYDLGVVCEQLRMYTTPAAQKQIAAFLIAFVNHTASEDERALLMVQKICRYINVNERDFALLRNEMSREVESDYSLLGINPNSSAVEIRAAYRQLILRLHPDRNMHLSETARKQLSARLLLIREAYERLKNKK